MSYKLIFTRDDIPGLEFLVKVRTMPVAIIDDRNHIMNPFYKDDNMRLVHYNPRQPLIHNTTVVIGNFVVGIPQDQSSVGLTSSPAQVLNITDYPAEEYQRLCEAAGEKYPEVIPTYEQTKQRMIDNFNQAGMNIMSRLHHSGMQKQFASLLHPCQIVEAPLIEAYMFPPEQKQKASNRHL